MGNINDKRGPQSVSDLMKGMNLSGEVNRGGLNNLQTNPMPPEMQPVKKAPKKSSVSLASLAPKSAEEILAEIDVPKGKTTTVSIRMDEALAEAYKKHNAKPTALMAQILKERAQDEGWL